MFGTDKQSVLLDHHDSVTYRFCFWRPSKGAGGAQRLAVLCLLCTSPAWNPVILPVCFRRSNRSITRARV